MDPQFWLDRWRRNEIGFHQPTAHAALAEHWPSLGVARDARVFVPLAGKSLDLVWLAAAGHRVVGIELAREAVDAFAAEQGPQPRVDLRCGDVFELTPETLGPVDAVFDRAALVALPPRVRARYAQQLTDLTAPGTVTLLVTVEYAQEEMAGPPHAVLEPEVHTLYGRHHDIELLGRNAALADFPKFAQRGVRQLAEAVYRLQRRNT
jgi:thiopurine S-methyltransferase